MSTPYLNPTYSIGNNHSTGVFVYQINWNQSNERREQRLDIVLEPYHQTCGEGAARSAEGVHRSDK